MLRLQSIVNASDSLCFSSIGRRKTLKNIGSAQNLIFRTHITNRNENALSSVSSTSTTSRLLFTNSIWLKMPCIKEIHTQIIPRCQAGKTNQMNNINLKIQLNDDVEVVDKQNNEAGPRRHHSEKQLLHKQTAYHTEILKEFPIPISSLHSIYSIVQSQLKLEQAITFKYTENKQKWTCNCTVKWPEERVFTATDRSKRVSASSVALQCLNWLKESGKLKNGLPVVFDVRKIHSSLRKPSRIHLELQLQKKVEELLNKYETSVKPIIARADLPKFEPTEDDADVGNYSRDSWTSTLRHRNIINRPKIHPDDRNFELHKRLQEREPVGYELPINSYKDEILKQIENNQIVLIKGDTGCGKTTQVPQLIMDSFTKKGQASKCNIVVTQPRRISATSLADRIARERGERLGDVVGYKVKLQQHLPQTPGAILFCTTGVLLKKMQDNPDLIGCSHLILDEAHERNVDIDMLLALLKRVVKKNRDIKIIIMSATLNADLFQNYFECASLEIPGKSYPVKMHFAEDIAELVRAKWIFEEPEQKYYRPQVECDKVAKVVQWISDNKPQGAILCFLPGWTEIVQVEKLLKENNKKRTRQMVLPIHSLLPHYDQQKIFEKPPSGVRKIILATDIAETGITVPDVVYVVDSATHKEVRWDKVKEVDTMQSYRIAQANLHQRRGRAGRVQPGESFHLMTKSEYEQLKPFPVPEIKCVSLERVALDCKLYSRERVEEFLSTMIDPPDMHVVRTSVENLIKLGALDKEENLTVLGKKMGMLNLSPILGKTLIYSSIFNCVDPILTLVTLFSMNIEIFRNALIRKDEIRSIKRRFSSSSDHLALSWLYMQWEAFIKKDEALAERFADETGLNYMRMFTVKKLRNQHSRHLGTVLGIRESVEDVPTLKRYSQSDEMVKAVILSGVDHVVKYVGYERVRDRFVKSNRVLQDENGNDTRTTPESVNHLREDFPTPYFTYIKKTFSFERRKTMIRDSSAISPLTVMLFSQGHIFGYEHKTETDLSTSDMELPHLRDCQIIVKVSDKDNVSLLCSENVASLLFEFRDSIWATVRYLVENEGHFALESRDLEIVSNYRNEMLEVLDEMLTVAAKNMNTKVQETEEIESDPFDVEKIF